MPDGSHYDLSGKRIWVAGHTGMVGGAVVRRLAAERCEVVTATRRDADLRKRDDVDRLLARLRPNAVVVAAAKVGGILANDTHPVDFLEDNLRIATGVIGAAAQFGVEKLLFLGSSCIYPREAAQPITEDALLTGPLEPTNRWYAVAKIAGLMLCQAYRRQHGCDFISAMPCNLYGPGDNFDVRSGHVIPALMAKAHAARMSRSPVLDVWGTGRPRREFLYVEDLADALVHLLVHYSDERTINVGTGSDVTIAELVHEICKAVGFEGNPRFDPERPDGTVRKVLDVSRIEGLGWKARTPLHQGLQQTYGWYLDHIGKEGARVRASA
jgi:GDP-L-fucose synthase